MSQQELWQWEQEVSRRMPVLSNCQARILAWWSFSIMVLQSCSRTAAAHFLGLFLGEKVGNMEQRLYEWYVEKETKAGQKRQEIEWETCFAPLLKWIVDLWDGEQMALTLDATTLKADFTLLVVSVCFKGIGIPVAWYVTPGNQRGSWQPHWQRLLSLIEAQIPAEWQVLVLADRGLYAPWLFKAIQQRHWHPFLRVNANAKFRVKKGDGWQWLSALVRPDGQFWAAQGQFSKKHRLPCTLLVWQSPAHDTTWFVITDLDPDGCQITWYGLRNWCEQGFKCTKRGGWQWQRTRVQDPQRVSRIWLALAVAILWSVSMGADLEEGHILPELAKLLPAPSGPYRRLRLLRVGVITFLVVLCRQLPWPMPTRLSPDPWPECVIVHSEPIFPSVGGP